MKQKLIAIGGLVLVGFIAHRLVVGEIRRRVSTERKIAFVASDEELDTLGEPKPDPAFVPPPDVVPFEEVQPFDDDAHNWSNVFSQYGGSGIAIFDANGDGLLDVYLTHDGQNWTRPTDGNGVLLDEPRYQSNQLYLNRGNDARGVPIFESVAKLVHGNETLHEEELMVEGFLVPRQHGEDSRKRWARSANVAVAADFNGDGRLDLLVGNEPKGIFWSSPETQDVLIPMVDPIGRERKRFKLPLAALALSMIEYVPRQGVDDSRESSRGREPEGANTLYLNLGDQDGDGIPEWRDVSREAGIEGRRSTYGLAVADIDLDGDLDIYASSSVDLDFWPGGAKGWAGGTNELFINQLAQTGELKFVEDASRMNADGLFDDDYPRPPFYKLRTLPFLPFEYSIALHQVEAYFPDYLRVNGEEAEHAEVSWATMFQDFDDDGYPDLWVANDLGFMRLYRNVEGRRFEDTRHARSDRSGSWMSLAPADYNGDLVEDVLAGNLGGGVMSHEYVTLDIYRIQNPTIIDALAYEQFMLDKHDWTHAIIDGANVERELPHQVRHSRILPPDASLPRNQRRHAPKGYAVTPFDSKTLDPYEFAWGMTPIDVQNDGKQDFYYVGCLYSRGGYLSPISGTGPGRLLVNAGHPRGELRFVDLTAEYRVFDIQELRYDRLESEGYIYRPAPNQGWSKRDWVRSTDRSTWSSEGADIQEHVTNQDMIQTAEHGRGAAAADLNGDGYADLVVTNMGGYDSRSSKAVNLKAMIDGRPQVLPAPDSYFPTLTSYEPGRTRLFLNRHRGDGWVAVRLVDETPGTFNREAIGARVVVNEKFLRVKRSGDGSFISNVSTDLLFGLSGEAATKIEVVWPDRARTRSSLELQSLRGGTVTISKDRGVIAWNPATDGAARLPHSAATTGGGSQGPRP